jgi:hypothetical protein
MYVFHSFISFYVILFFCHKVDDVFAFGSRRKHECVFLPAYSSDLNMIENVFSKLQSYVNNRIDTENITTNDELIECIHDSTQAVPLEQYEQYYKRVNIFYTLCSNVDYYLK